MLNYFALQMVDTCCTRTQQSLGKLCDSHVLKVPGIVYTSTLENAVDLSSWLLCHLNHC